MLIKLKWLFIIFFFSAQSSWADDACRATPQSDKRTKNIDLRSEMGPLRDQDSIGWCYGFTGADLLTHYLYKTHASEVRSPDRNADYRSHNYAVSAVGISTFFNRDKMGDFFSGVKDVKNANELKLKYKKNVVPEAGTIAESLEAAKRDGFCFEKDLPSENFSYVRDSRCASRGNCNLEDMLKIVFDEASPGRNCKNPAAIQKLFPTLTASAIKNILSITVRKNAIDRLAAVACRKQFSVSLFSENKPVIKQQILNDPKSPKFQSGFAKRTHEDLIANVDEVLNKGTPVGILFYANFLVSPNPKQSSAHAVSVVGKRFNPKTCEVEYILRNSWGDNCDMYNIENSNYGPCVIQTKKETNPKIIYAKMRDCRQKFPPVSRNPRVSCDPQNHYAYVRKSDLTKAMYGTAYIEE